MFWKPRESGVLRCILITRNDMPVFKTWMDRHASIFESVSIVDGSDGPETSEVCSGFDNVIYSRDPDGPITDQTLRKQGWDALCKNGAVRRGDWICICHPDEFFFHDPRKFLTIRRNRIQWIALHILPHPSEKAAWLQSRSKNVTEVFHHYWWKNGDVPTREDRMFRYCKDVHWDTDNPEPSSYVLPASYLDERAYRKTPIYWHYKVISLDVDDYEGTMFRKSRINTRIGGREITCLDDLFFDERRPWGHKGFEKFSNDMTSPKFDAFPKKYRFR